MNVFSYRRQASGGSSQGDVAGLTKAQMILVRSIPQRMDNMKIIFKEVNQLKSSIKSLSDKLTSLDHCCEQDSNKDDYGSDSAEDYTSTSDSTSSSDSGSDSVSDSSSNQNDFKSQNDEPFKLSTFQKPSFIKHHNRRQ